MLSDKPLNQRDTPQNKPDGIWYAKGTAWIDFSEEIGRPYSKKDIYLIWIMIKSNA